MSNFDCCDFLRTITVFEIKTSYISSVYIYGQFVELTIEFKYYLQKLSLQVF